MNDLYLIPANSKRSMLIFGLFTPIDLIIASIGAGITFILILTIDAHSLKDILLLLIPLLTSALMLLPIPNQRNLWTFMANVYHYLSNRRTYYWKGWCMMHGEESRKSNK